MRSMCPDCGGTGTVLRIEAIANDDGTESEYSYNEPCMTCWRPFGRAAYWHRGSDNATGPRTVIEYLKRQALQPGDKPD